MIRFFFVKNFLTNFSQNFGNKLASAGGVKLLCRPTASCSGVLEYGSKWKVQITTTKVSSVRTDRAIRFQCSGFTTKIAARKPDTWCLDDPLHLKISNLVLGVIDSC